MKPVKIDHLVCDFCGDTLEAPIDGSGWGAHFTTRTLINCIRCKPKLMDYLYLWEALRTAKEDAWKLIEETQLPPPRAVPPEWWPAAVDGLHACFWHTVDDEDFFRLYLETIGSVTKNLHGEWVGRLETPRTNLFKLFPTKGDAWYFVRDGLRADDYTIFEAETCTVFGRIV